MSKELINREVEDLENEASRRDHLQKIMYGYTIVGGVLGGTGNLLFGVSARNEIQILTGLFSFIDILIAYDVLSRINVTRKKLIEQELDLRRGQLRFFDNQGKVRTAYE